MTTEKARVPEHVPPEDVELIDIDAMVAAQPYQLSHWLDTPQMAWKVMAAMDRYLEQKAATEPEREERTYIWRPRP